MCYSEYFPTVFVFSACIIDFIHSDTCTGRVEGCFDLHDIEFILEHIFTFMNERFFFKFS